ncbi:MAG TPA: alpha/beta hydrolase [Kofleriaceae bacterium]|nr:alpha/beta hydrolase [Kofleriaceae bacterium]
MTDTSTDTMQAGYVDVDGCRTAFDVIGGGDRGTIVCLHSAGASSLDWTVFAEHAARAGYRVIAPDLPGHGKSLLRDWRALETTQELARWTLAFTTALGIERPVLAGCSLGGAIVLELAVAEPARWRAIVCTSSVARHGMFPRAFLDRGREDAGLPGFGDFTYERTLALCGRETPAERCAELAWLRRRADPKVAMADLRAFNALDVAASLGQITAPTLLVRGADDPIPAPAFEATARAIPAAELVTIAGAGHYPMAETPRFAELVIEFLARRT